MVDGPRWSHWRRCARIDYRNGWRKVWEGQERIEFGAQRIGGDQAWDVVDPIVGGATITLLSMADEPVPSWVTPSLPIRNDPQIAWNS